MSEKRTGRQSARASSTDWERLRKMSDESVRAAVEADPDAHPTDPSFWKSSKVVMPARKQAVTIRLDADLLEWFRKEKGYQTRINAILRTYMEAQHSE